MCRVNPSESIASISSLESRIASTSRVAATTTTLSELPTIIPATGTSTRDSRGRICNAKSTERLIPNPNIYPAAVVHMRPWRRFSRFDAESAANGIIATTHNHAHMTGVSSLSMRVKAQPAITSCPTDLPVAIVKSRSSLRRNKSDIPMAISIIAKEATSPHQPTITSCIDKRYWGIQIF